MRKWMENPAVFLLFDSPRTLVSIILCVIHKSLFLLGQSSSIFLLSIFQKELTFLFLKQLNKTLKEKKPQMDSSFWLYL